MNCDRDVALCHNEQYQYRLLVCYERNGYVALIAAGAGFLLGPVAFASSLNHMFTKDLLISVTVLGSPTRLLFV